MSRLPSCGSESKGELPGRLHAEAAMWSDLIGLHAPGRDHHPRLAQRIKQIARKALSAELVMEALDVAVLPRAARIDVEGFDARFSQPRLKGLSYEFGTVITAYVAGAPWSLMSSLITSSTLPEPMLRSTCSA